MENFTNYFPELVEKIAPFLTVMIMKLDKDLPWAIRIFRWLAVAYFAGFVAVSLKNWFC